MKPVAQKRAPKNKVLVIYGKLSGSDEVRKHLVSNRPWFAISQLVLTK